MKDIKYCAIDFETATKKEAPACAVGIVTVLNGEIIDEYNTLIQPPKNEYDNFLITIHNITPQMTKNFGDFKHFYPEIKKRIDGNVIVAHNENFDRKVLMNCMKYYNISLTELKISNKWVCTQRIYKKLGYKPYNLNGCCEKLNIQLKHHDALSDARGCALLYLQFLKDKKVL